MYHTNKIVQVDGNDSIDDDDDEFVFDDNDSTVQLVPRPGPVLTPTPEPITTDQRTASFALNRNKQIQTLAVDATRPDFEIEINDCDKNQSATKQIELFITSILLYIHLNNSFLGNRHY